MTTTLSVMRSLLQFVCLVSAVGFVATLLAGCGGSDNPDLVEVTRKYGIAYCDALERCMGKDAFNASYAGGQTDCAARTYRIQGTEDKSICSRDQWDICFEDMKTTSCSSSGNTKLPVIPPSCLDC